MSKAQFRQDNRDLLVKSVVSLSLKITGAAAAFLLSVVTGRCLGKDGAGLFFLAIAIVTPLAVVARLGLDNVINRFAAQALQKSDWHRIVSLQRSSVAIVLASSLTFANILYFSSAFLSESVFDDVRLESPLRILSWAIVAVSLTWIHSALFQGLHLVKRFQILQNLGLSIVFLVLIGAGSSLWSFGNLTVEYFSKCYLTASVIMFVTAGLWWWLLTRNQQVQSERIAKQLLFNAAPLLAIVILQQFTLWLPQIVLGAYSEASQVGTYNAAFRTANLASILLTGVNSVVLPKFAAYHASNELRRMENLAKSSTAAVLVLCLPCLVLLECYPESILSLFGKDFRSGARVLQILALGQLVNVATGAVGGLLNMTGNQLSGMLCNLFGFFVLILSLAVLVPEYGEVGAAVSQSSALVFNLLLLTIVCRWKFGFSPVEGIFKLGPYTHRIGKNIWSLLSFKNGQ